MGPISSEKIADIFPYSTVVGEKRKARNCGNANLTEIIKGQENCGCWKCGQYLHSV